MRTPSHKSPVHAVPGHGRGDKQQTLHTRTLQILEQIALGVNSVKVFLCLGNNEHKLIVLLYFTNFISFKVATPIAKSFLESVYGVESKHAITNTEYMRH